jgi:hypothetical protein
MLVDEFNIPHTPKINLWSNEMTLDPMYWCKDQGYLESNIPFLKILELDDTGERSMDLRVEIHNDDNNYANGFMTQSTLVLLCQCWLAPVKVWEQFDQIWDRWKYSRHNWNKYYNHTRSVTYYYPGWRNHIFDNLAIYADMHFPNITQQLQSEEQLKSHCSNHQDLPQIWQEFPNLHWTGASGYFHLSLAKKLGFWRHSTDRRRGYWKLSLIKNVKDLYDKYRNDEDKRSVNT